MTTGFMDISIQGQGHEVEAMLARLDTALHPAAVAGFLGVKVGPYLQARAKSRFQSEGDDVSGGWAPLKQWTLKYRAEGRQEGKWSVGDAHPINVRTHELENYITGNAGLAAVSGLGASLVFPKPNNKRSIKEKMRTAQAGRAFPRTVARPVIGLNENDLVYILTALALHIKGQP